jgi:hypothetical protein
MDLNQKLTGVVRFTSTNVRPFKGSKEFKTVKLRIDYSDCSIEDIITGKAVAHDTIAFANGASGRANYEHLVHMGTVDIKASSPGAKPPEDPMDILIALAKESGRTLEEQLAFEKSKRGLA